MSTLAPASGAVSEAAAPAYYTKATLAAAAGVSLSTFDRHERENVGRLRDVREDIKGLGIRYQASKVKRYLDLCAAAGRGPKPLTPRKSKTKTQPVSHDSTPD